MGRYSGLEILERELLLSSLSPPTPLSDLAVERAKPGVNSVLVTLLDLIRHGKYLAVLQSRQSSSLLQLSIGSLGSPLTPEAANDYYESLSVRVHNYIQEKRKEEEGMMSAEIKDRTEKEMLVLTMGVAALYIFVQANLTGPEVETPASPHSLFVQANGPAGLAVPDLSQASAMGRNEQRHPWDGWARKELMIDGSDALGKYALSQYLLLARILLVPSAHATPGVSQNGSVRGQGQVQVETGGPHTRPWWAARVLLMHQRVLAETSPTLRRLLLGYTKLNLQRFGDPGALEESTWGGPWEGKEGKMLQRVIAAEAQLEAGLMEHAYGHTDAARMCFARAAEACGLKWEVTGALGYRTKYQIDPKAQMVLVTSSELADSEDANVSDSEREVTAGDHALAAVAPMAVDPERSSSGCQEESAEQQQDKAAVGPMFSGESEILMRPKLVDETEVKQSSKEKVDEEEVEAESEHTEEGQVKRLAPVEQAIVLAQCLDVRKNNPDDELRSWQMAPFIEAVNAQKHSRPMLRASCELLRVRWERARARTRERALATMEQLVDGIRQGSPNVAARMRYAFAVWLPTWAALQKEYGELLVANGLMGEALTLFERLELWDSLIDCYRLLGKKAAATELVKERLQVQPDDPRLWCCLGDLTFDESAYHKAWHVSGNRYARAKRSLARMAFNRGAYEDSITHWEAALAINPLHSDGWFSFGCTALQAKELDKALRAFTRSVQVDPDNGESWNNIAVINLQKKRSKEAFTALQEALKYKRDSWQLWDNFTQVALDIGNFTQGVRAMRMVLDLTRNKHTDTASIARMVDEVEARRGLRPPAAPPAAPEPGKEEEEEEEEEEEDLFVDMRPLESSPASLARVEAGASGAGEAWPREGLAEGGKTPANGDGNQVQEQGGGSGRAEGEEEKGRGGGGGGGAAAGREGEKEEVDGGESRAREWLENEVRLLIGRVAASGGGGGDIWAQQARFFRAVGEPSLASEALLKHVRQLQGSNWQHNSDKFKVFSQASVRLCQAYLQAAERAIAEKEANGGRRELSAARMHLRNVLKQGEAFQGTEEYEALESTLHEVQAMDGASR